MRKRFQNGSVKKSKDGRYWLGSWREDDGSGRRRQRTHILGKVGRMTKSKADAEMAKIVRPINGRVALNAPPDITMNDFVEKVYFPFYSRKWKRLTAESRTTSIRHHILGAFGSRTVASLTRNELQQFLDKRKTMAFTMVDHLRWDLKQIFDLAVAEDVIPRSPVYVSGAMLLFVPRGCGHPDRPTMNEKEVKKILELLDLRERVVVKLAVIAGMRVSEIFGLRRGRVKEGYVEIKERVCKRDVDTPKTAKAVRLAALSAGLQEDLREWLSSSPDTGPDGWLFPSETLTTPIGSENLLNRYIRPRLKKVGLDWVEFRVMRRTHSSLMNARGVNPKLIADQQGHGLDVNLNVYTQSSVESRIEALQTLESAFVN
jgi:integrase